MKNAKINMLNCVNMVPHKETKEDALKKLDQCYETFEDENKEIKARWLRSLEDSG